jgi:rhodanese-related sulfurtransferase
MSNIHELRPELGGFNSIVCFKAVVTGTEEALGEKAAAIALIAAGRNRGKQVAEALGITGKGIAAEIVPLLQKVLGKEGTRLCIVDSITQKEETIVVHCRETICSAGEPQGSLRKLTFTLGAVQGVLEQVTGKRLRGKQTESVLRGGSHDVIEFETI